MSRNLYKLFAVVVVLLASLATLYIGYVGPTAHLTSNRLLFLKFHYRPEPYQFTQGLVWVKPNLFIESSGLYRHSEIHFLHFPNMSISGQVKNPPNVFAEGCDLVHFDNGTSRVIQLTWNERVIFIFDENLKLVDKVRLPDAIKEGWGLTHMKDPKTKEISLFISEGSNKIFIVDPTTWKVRKTLNVVTDKKKTVRMLNELEMVDNHLWANIYLTNTIAVIDPATGVVQEILEFPQLHQEYKTHYTGKYSQGIPPDNVLNGIAFDPVNRKYNTIHTNDR